MGKFVGNGTAYVLGIVLCNSAYRDKQEDNREILFHRWTLFVDVKMTEELSSLALYIIGFNKGKIRLQAFISQITEQAIKWVGLSDLMVEL